MNGSSFWKIISNENLQRTLAWAGGGFAAVIGALWAAYVYWHENWHENGPKPLPVPPIQACNILAGGGVTGASIHCDVGLPNPPKSP